MDECTYGLIVRKTKPKKIVTISSKKFLGEDEWTRLESRLVDWIYFASKSADGLVVFTKWLLVDKMKDRKSSTPVSGEGEDGVRAQLPSASQMWCCLGRPDATTRVEAEAAAWCGLVSQSSDFHTNILDQHPHAAGCV